jgi:hypothetical protein
VAAAADPAQQVTAIVAAMATAQAAELAGFDATGAGPAARAARHSARIRALLGASFPVLPRFTAAEPSALAASNADADLLGGDPLAARAWLARIGLVRDGVARLATALEAAELLGGGLAPKQVAVAQLPAAAGERWLALPFPSAGPASAQLAVLACMGGPVRFDGPLAGLFCDGWNELIPEDEQTTGMAVHHDAPGARPPQAVLLAVPPAAQNPAWSTDAILDTIAEANVLARIRAVGPRELRWTGTLLPAIYLPGSLSKDVPTVDLAGLAAKFERTSTVLGKA